MPAYITLAKPAEAELIVKKSRFLAAMRPVDGEEAALAFLRERRALHPAASHHCYAYIVGENSGIMRYSDDGEPGGTAGQPILEALRARGVTFAAAVVTRYFGGTLLGAGGLTRAYGGAAGAAIEAAGLAAMEPTARLTLRVPYALLGRVERALEALPAQVMEKTFEQDITLALETRTRDEAAVCAAITEASDGRILPERAGEIIRGW